MQSGTETIWIVLKRAPDKNLEGSFIYIKYIFAQSLRTKCHLYGFEIGVKRVNARIVAEYSVFDDIRIKD